MCPEVLAMGDVKYHLECMYNNVYAHNECIHIHMLNKTPRVQKSEANQKQQLSDYCYM